MQACRHPALHRASASSVLTLGEAPAGRMYLRGVQAHAAQVVNYPHDDEQEGGQLQQPRNPCERCGGRRSNPVPHRAAAVTAQRHPKGCARRLMCGQLVLKVLVARLG